jgi:hypothetical protein
MLLNHLHTTHAQLAPMWRFIAGKHVLIRLLLHEGASYRSAAATCAVLSVQATNSTHINSRATSQHAAAACPPVMKLLLPSVPAKWP